MSTDPAVVAAHTPGEWKLEQSAANSFSIFADQGRMANPEIASLIEGEHGDRGEILANGALMAAAPRLLEAVKALRSIVADPSEKRSVIAALDKAEAAIARARPRLEWNADG